MKPRAFVMMPFSSDLESIYKALIVKSLIAAGYDTTRADDIRSQSNILKDVIGAIQTSDLLVADLTGSNPNVYYELGIAHALNRPVILLTQDINELPFDLRSYRVIPYSTHFEQIDKARNELEETARAALNKTLSFGNPISDFALTPTRLATEQSALDDEASERADDRGYLDHMVEFLDGMSGLEQIVNDINSGTNQIGDQTSKTTSKLSATSTLTLSEKRKAVQLLATQQLSYGKLLETSNDSFRRHLRQIESNIEYLFGGAVPVQNDAKDSLLKVIDSLDTAEEGARKGRDSYISLFETINALPNLERNFDRAKKYVATQLTALVANMEQMISFIVRARELAKRIVEGQSH